MKTAPSSLIPRLHRALLAVLVMTSCSPIYVLPGNDTPKPTEPDADALVVACGEPSRRIFVPESSRVRVIGPLLVRVLSQSGEEHKYTATTCKDTSFHCLLDVPDDSILEVNVGRLEKSGNEWGTLCFEKKPLGFIKRRPDCEEAEKRIDVRVSCPETRFAKREAYGLRSAPLPAHLPVDVTCKLAPGNGRTLDCTPALVALEAAPLHVHGALQLAGGPRTVKPDEVLVFSLAPGAGGPDQSAVLCIRDACSNPAYFLQLRVDFEDTSTNAGTPGVVGPHTAAPGPLEYCPPGP